MVPFRRFWAVMVVVVSAIHPGVGVGVWRSFVVVTDKTDLGWEHRHVMFPNKDSESQRKKAQEMSTLNLLGHW
jgi:hypothetical protein